MNRSVKSVARDALSAARIYPRIKYSNAYDVYCRLFLREYWKDLRARVAFFERILGRDAVVFDIGANGGAKADLFRRFARRVVCVEPDKESLDVLRARFRHRLNVVVVAKAIGAEEGMGELFVESAGSPFNTLSVKWKDALGRVNAPRNDRRLDFANSYPVQVTTLDKLICEHGIPDYIKLDVEGFELNALRGLTSPVRFVSLEANLPEFLSETIECVSLLHRLSPALEFAYSTHEGFGGPLSKWLAPDDFVAFIVRTSHPFLEVLARLAP